MKYKAEDAAAQKYHADLFAWRRSGRTGPEPTKPNIPEHDKVAAKVKTDKLAIEAQVKQSMPANEQASLAHARTEYKQAVAAAGGHRSEVRVPPEIAAYNRQIGRATREFVEGKQP